ncbi:hypothetical protein [Streptomyces sp. NPDC054865]
MTASTRPTAHALRFCDGDTVSFESGLRWTRGGMQPGQWATCGTSERSSDEAMHSTLAAGPESATFTPVLPDVFRTLPGTPCGSREVLDALVLRPATGAVLYTASLNRVQSFLGNDRGALRPNHLPQHLTLATVRASLRGTAHRHPRAQLTYHRMTGRLYARYAVGESVHTHIYVLTTG